MKLLVLAHTPPPFHGQSYMVRILLDCCQTASTPHGDHIQHGAPTLAPTQPEDRIECLHIDFRLSHSVDDIGQRPWSKLVLLFRYCAQAIRARFRHRATTLLYVPAPALRHAIYRDWLVMLCCRPFFQKRVFWWHAAGLGPWLRDHAKPVERWLTDVLVARPDLSLVLGTETQTDARLLGSRRIVLLPNAIPDPCCDRADELVRQKAARRETIRARLDAVVSEQAEHGPRAQITTRFRLLFIGLCYSQKGLFDAVEAVARANHRLTTHRANVRVQLDVAGRFFLSEEQRQFEERIRKADLLLSKPNLDTGVPIEPVEGAVSYHGFVTGSEKNRLFQECDCLVFPTYYPAESFGLVVLEAMAYGLDVIASRWHGIPELLPPHHPGLVNPRDPQALDTAIDLFLRHYEGDQLRRHYEENFTLTKFQCRLEAALHLVDPAQRRA